MTNWQYCIIMQPTTGLAEKDSTRKIKSYLSFLGPSEEETKTEEIENPFHELARLGAEGWELISHTQRWEPMIEGQKTTSAIYPIAQVYVLKREIPKIRRVTIV